MMYQITAIQGDDGADWVIEAPAHRKGRVPDAVIKRALHLAGQWCERGENMAECRVEIAAYWPARVGYRSGDTSGMTSTLAEYTVWSERHDRMMASLRT